VQLTNCACFELVRICFASKISYTTFVTWLVGYVLGIQTQSLKLWLKVTHLVMLNL